jgi:peptide/nickel transport system ATP-binding protein
MVQAQVLRLLTDLVRQEGAGLVLISHDLAVLGSTCDRVAVLYAGQVVEEGPAAAVLGAPRHPYAQALAASFPRVGDAAVRRAPRGLPGDPPDPRTVPPGCPFHPRCPRVIEACRSGPVPLRLVEPGRHAACLRVAP